MRYPANHVQEHRKAPEPHHAGTKVCIATNEHGLEAVLNEQDFVDLWILSDSRSSLQHIYYWITVRGKAGVSIFQKLTQIRESHDVHFQWILSHVNIFGNEQADLLVKEGGPRPTHHLYESKHPGSSILLKCGRASQTASSRLKSGHIVFPFVEAERLLLFAPSASLSRSHLGLLGTFEGGPFSSPLLDLDFLGSMVFWVLSNSVKRRPCVFSNHTKAPGTTTFEIAAPITCAALDAHPSKPSFGVVLCTRKLDCSEIEPGRLKRMNPDSISAVMTIVFVCADPVVNASILRLLYSDTSLPQLV
ncbi:RNase H domain-containing protein [Trichonephila clavipes]|nr:RNase H domain-containing protein [Trichonephila clavipes]